MYGLDTIDPIVKYYDISFAIGSDEEIAWYLQKAATFGGPVLDLAGGTGRLSLALAQHGHDVTCLDQSVGMLRQFSKKLEKESAAIQQRIHLENQAMTNFALANKFNTIICCDAFFHNLTVQEEIDCLRCVRDHLLPQGRFVFNLPNPTCEFILNSVTSAGQNFVERGRYPLADSTHTLVIEDAYAGNILDQTTRTILRFTTYDASGAVVDQQESAWTSRYLFRYEAIHLLYRCGFEVDALVGDYQNGPVTETGQLIFQAKYRGS